MRPRATQCSQGWQLVRNKALEILKEGPLIFPCLGEAWDWPQPNSRGQIGDFLPYGQEEMRKGTELWGILGWRHGCVCIVPVPLILRERQGLFQGHTM